MGGTDRDTSLHERQGGAAVDLVPPINPDLSLIPHFAYVEESRASCRSALQSWAQPSRLSLALFYRLVNRGSGRLGKSRSHSTRWG